MQGQNGQDATKAIEQGVMDAGKKLTRDAMQVWHTSAVARVMEAASGRSGIDAQRDQRGSLQGRENNALHEIANEFSAPFWDDSDGKWAFSVTHRFAGMHEWGAQPHEIRAQQAQALVFEWPDAPKEVREQYEDTFPKVFFDSVQHPGVPGIGFIRYGRAQARSRLQDAGFSTTEFAQELDADGNSGGEGES